MNKKIVAFVDLPPPVHGMSIINKSICDQLSDMQGCDLEVINTTSSKWFKVFKFFGYVFRPFMKSNRDVICYYISVYGMSGLFIQLPLIFSLVLSRKKIFIHHHSYACINRKSFAYIILSSLLRNSKGVHIFLSSKMAKDYIAVYGEVSYLVIDNLTFVPPRYSVSESIPHQQLVFGLLANHSAEKGLFDLIDIFQDIVSVRSAKLILAGYVSDSDQEVIRSRIKNPDLVVFLGPLYGEEKFTRFYRKIDALVFPTRYINEAQPLVIYEALSCGAAVFATDIGTINCQIDKHVFGTVFKSCTSSAERSVLILKYFEKYPNNIMRCSSIINQYKMKYDLHSENRCLVYSEICKGQGY